jgi:hypothetical protein
MFHSTAMVADYDDAVAKLAALGGLRVLEYSDNPQPEIGRRGGMTWLGDNSIEIGQPTFEGGGADRFVRRTGGGLHSIAVQVADIEAALQHAEAVGVAVAARPMPEMFFTDPRRTDGVFIEWGAFELHIDPRFGATVPPVDSPPLLAIERQAFVGAVVAEPLATAARLADLLGTAVTFEHPDAGAGEPVAGVSLGDCTLALYPLPEDDAVWGATYAAPRCHLLALSVPDLAAAAAALDASAFGVIRTSETMVVLDPATTGGVQVAIVDRLLPGDPRQ